MGLSSFRSSRLLDFLILISCASRAEAKNGGLIITTAEELKIYHTVKTILLSSFKKIEPSRITYRDNKNSFIVLVDDNQKKTVCRITSNRGKHYLEINGYDQKHEVNGIDSIVNLSKTLKVQLNSKVTTLKRHNEAWLVEDESGQSYSSKKVLLTAPLPQALALLEQNNKLKNQTG